MVADYRGVILIGGTWNPAVVRTDAKMLAFIREAAKRGLPIFSICHAAQRNAGAEVVEDQAVVVDIGSTWVAVLCEPPNSAFDRSARRRCRWAPVALRAWALSIRTFRAVTRSR